MKERENRGPVRSQAPPPCLSIGELQFTVIFPAYRSGMNNLLLSVTALLASSAVAAPVISPQSILVNPAGSKLQVSLWTDRDPSGVKSPTYRVGDPVHFYATVNQDAYVYLFDVAQDGVITQILPNRFDGGDNFVKSRTVRSFPGQGADFVYNVGGALGVSKILAVASHSRLDLSSFSSFKDSDRFARVSVQGQQQLAQALSIVVTPVADNSWGTATVQFNVQAPPAAVQVIPVSTTIVTTPAPLVVVTSPPEVVYVPAAPQVVYVPVPQMPASQPPRPPQPSVSLTVNIGLSVYGRAEAVQAQGNGYSFRSNDRLDQVFAYYDHELGRQGYRRTAETQGRDALSGNYQGRDGSRATLRVFRDHDRVNVRLTPS